jgi:hypothetical protein
MYNINAIFPQFIMDIKNPVVLTSIDPTNFPLPSPEYLRLHAACARVAHFFGARKYIDSRLDDMETMQVFAEDGSSKAALSFALSGRLGALAR